MAHIETAYEFPIPIIDFRSGSYPRNNVSNIIAGQLALSYGNKKIQQTID